MVQTVIMPKLGQSVEESAVLKWHKREGEQVAKGDILFEIETDKAILEVESFFEGTLLKIIVAEGQTVPVLTPVAFIGQKGEPIPEVKPLPRPAPAPDVPMPASSQDFSAASRSPITALPARGDAPSPPLPAPHASISPRARRLVRERAISAEPIKGTGPNGRVTEKDVLAYLAEKNYNSIRITPSALNLAREHGIDVLWVPSRVDGEKITVETIRRAIAEKPSPMSRMRQTIAGRLAASWTSAPHFFVTVSVDMTDLMKWRRELKKEKKFFSATDFILKAVAMALQKFPALNSSTDGRTVRQHAAVRLGIAVALDDGLVVPVLRDAQELSLYELHERASALVSKARAGKLSPDEMSGSTFTVSNMGMLEVENFTAIINPGESGILAVSGISASPVVRKEKIAIRDMMKITLSADHRLVDGAVAAQFVNHVKKALEDLESWKNMI